RCSEPAPPPRHCGSATLVAGRAAVDVRPSVAALRAHPRLRSSWHRPRSTPEPLRPDWTAVRRANLRRPTYATGPESTDMSGRNHLATARARTLPPRAG